jgi:hypothetical protein
MPLFQFHHVLIGDVSYNPFIATDVVGNVLKSVNEAPIANPPHAPACHRPSRIRVEGVNLLTECYTASSTFEALSRLHHYGPLVPVGRAVTVIFDLAAVFVEIIGVPAFTACHRNRNLGVSSTQFLYVICFHGVGLGFVENQSGGKVQGVHFYGGHPILDMLLIGQNYDLVYRQDYGLWR